MGVIQNLYALLPGPREPEALRRFCGEARAAGLIEGPFLHGGAQRRAGGPLIAPWIADAVPHEAHTALEQALMAFLADPKSTLTAVALAAQYRREPELFYDTPAALGLFAFEAPHPLVIGAPEDLSWLAETHPELVPSEPQQPIFDEAVASWLWLSGKNAPLLEDFEGSPLHDAILRIWPEAVFVEETHA